MAGQPSFHWGAAAACHCSRYLPQAGGTASRRTRRITGRTGDRARRRPHSRVLHSGHGPAAGDARPPAGRAYGQTGLANEQRSNRRTFAKRSMSAYIPLTYSDLLLASIFLAMNALFSILLNLRLERQLIISATRMIA